MSSIHPFFIDRETRSKKNAYNSFASADNSAKYTLFTKHFGNLKKDLKVLCDYFDHSLIYETGSLKAETVAALQNEDFHLEEVSFRPTAENMARYFHEKIKALGYNMHAVTVYETPTNGATYMEQC